MHPPERLATMTRRPAGPRRGGEPLSAADVSNVVLDAPDQVNVYLLAGLLGVGGCVRVDGAVDLDRVRADVGARLRDPTVPELSRFSQRAVLRQGRWVWEPCEPDLARHVRSVDPVRGRDGLAGLCASLMVRPLAPDRPGWELLVAPGGADGTPAVVLRAHHAIADGVEGVRLAELLFGSAPAPAPSSTAGPPMPGHGRPWWRGAARGAVRVAALARRSVPATVLLGDIGPRRGVGFAETELAPVAEASRRVGGTVNDALLAGVAAATGAALRAVGRRVPAVLPASVPVALPDRAGSGNAVGVMVVDLPTGEPDIAARTARIAASTRTAKAGARAAGTFELTRSRWGSRLFAWLARRQRLVALFVTNVRGPSTMLVVSGAPLEHAWAVTPIQGNVRLGVTALSYRGRLACAVHTDADALDAARVSGALGAELTRLATGT